jgi:hypothetical protein
MVPVKLITLLSSKLISIRKGLGIMSRKQDITGNDMNVIDELQFRLAFSKDCSKMMPSERLPNSNKAVSYRLAANYAYAAYIYRRALNEKGFKDSLNFSIKLLEKAYEVNPTEKSICFSGLMRCHLLAKNVSKLKKVSEELLDEYEFEDTKSNVVENLFSATLAALFLQRDITRYIVLMAGYENEKRSTVLKGTTDAVKSLNLGHKKQFLLDIDKMLLEHHNTANKVNSRLYNTPHALLCPEVNLLLKLAEIKGWNVCIGPLKFEKELRIGLSSPADFPSLEPNLKMPFKINYLCGHVSMV